MTEPAPATSPGHLYVVATPIGNLDDLSPRALRVLREVDAICAEDTRTSGVLLRHFGIGTKLVAFHEHNEDRVAPELVRQLRGGARLALISDAGTPLVSDPGFALVRAARTAGVPVVAVPGPCAAIAALSIAGLPSDSFVFCGFLPAKPAQRTRRLEELAGETRTLVLYESAHRIEESLAAIVAILGADRPLCLARELSKRFEQSVTAPATEVLDWLRADANRSRGEFVLVIGGATAAAAADGEAERVLRVLLAELGAAQAARLAAAITGGRRNELYALAQRLGKKEPEDR